MSSSVTNWTANRVSQIIYIFFAYIVGSNFLPGILLK